MDDLRGKVAVVTGAASGIGLAMAERFGAEGMKVVLADIEEAPLAAAVERLAGGGVEVEGVRTDVSDAGSVEALAAATLDRFGAVHVLCNNAGVGGGGVISGLSLADWRWVLSVNLDGVIHGIHFFLPHLMASGEPGHIVNTASMAGLVAGPGIGPYNASKFAVVAISETLNAELAQAGSAVGVSVLCPGWVRTNILDSQRNRPDHLRVPDVAPKAEARARNNEIRRIFETALAPADVAGLVADAVKAGQFWIFTHPEMLEWVRMRDESIMTGANPPVTDPVK